jgi:hypothetical protein
LPRRHSKGWLLKRVPRDKKGWKPLAVEAIPSSKTSAMKFLGVRDNPGYFAITDYTAHSLRGYGFKSRVNPVIMIRWDFEPLVPTT